MSALDFEAEWERVLQDLNDIGLGKSELEKFLAYIEKVGSMLGETIRLDRRPRPDGAGGETTRDPRTWEEAHEVLIELESVRAGARAQTAARAAGAPTALVAGGANASPPAQGETHIQGRSLLRMARLPKVPVRR